jgi:quinol-cytochrome oxidoreductase complex cytochrome b subunit
MKIRLVSYNLAMALLFPFVVFAFGIMVDRTDNDPPVTPVTSTVGWIILVLYLVSLIMINYNGLKKYKIVSRAMSSIVISGATISISVITSYSVLTSFRYGEQ